MPEATWSPWKLVCIHLRRDARTLLLHVSHSRDRLTARVQSLEGGEGLGELIIVRGHLRLLVIELLRRFLERTQPLFAVAASGGKLVRRALVPLGLALRASRLWA